MVTCVVACGNMCGTPRIKVSDCTILTSKNSVRELGQVSQSTPFLCMKPWISMCKAWGVSVLVECVSWVKGDCAG